jgi:hypothetical protein
MGALKSLRTNKERNGREYAAALGVAKLAP